jgi:hypothetical protein
MKRKSWNEMFPVGEVIYGARKPSFLAWRCAAALLVRPLGWAGLALQSVFNVPQKPKLFFQLSLSLSISRVRGAAPTQIFMANRARIWGPIQRCSPLAISGAY